MIIYLCCKHIYSVISKNYLWQYISVANTFIPLYQIILLHIKATVTYCGSCKQIHGSCKQILKTEILVLKKTKYNTFMLLSDCSVYAKRKSRFIKNQEASGLELQEILILNYSNIQQHLRLRRQ